MKKVMAAVSKVYADKVDALGDESDELAALRSMSPYLNEQTCGPVVEKTISGIKSGKVCVCVNIYIYIYTVYVDVVELLHRFCC